MSAKASNGGLSRRDLFSGNFLRNLFAPVASTVGVTSATRFVQALETVLPESAPAPVAALRTVPVRCPW